MTGGQPVEGSPTVPQILQQMAAEGVVHLHLVSDEPQLYQRMAGLPAGTQVSHRDGLDDLQRVLREKKGVSVIVYAQVCAAEKRRRRKKKELVDPPKRVVINEEVCEGCGDCGVQSNCVSILPLETPLGRKRAIDQSSCNKDYSCVKGFCPSFVTVHGGGLKKRKGVGKVDFDALPHPVFATDLAQPWNILVTGIGGTGVVTIGALVGMAAHLEGKGATVLDQTGLAQKGGAVTCHLRVARDPSDIHAVRIAAGEADLVLGCDMVVVNDYWALSKIRAGRTHAVLNTYEAMPGTFTTRPDMQFPAAQIVDAVRIALGDEAPELVDATTLATTLLGDSIMGNLFMLGYAWQKGWVPLSLDALIRAIELNGAAIEQNRAAFNWGRMGAHDIATVIAATGKNTQPDMPDALALGGDSLLDDRKISPDLDTVIARRVAFLTEYQNAAYAQKYRSLVDQVRAAETARAPGASTLSETVARYAFKLMAYKDEYEVARLYTQPQFLQQIRDTFDGDYKLHFHLAPPLLARRDSEGHLVKREYGSWMLTAFKLLAQFKGLRGGALDVFGKTAERRMERQWIADYFTTVEELLRTLDADNRSLAVEIASVPEHIRGYGHVKEEHEAKAKTRWNELLATWRNPKALPVKLVA